MVQCDLDKTLCNMEDAYNERKEVETHPYWMETLRILRDEIRSYKEDNERIIKAQYKQE